MAIDGYILGLLTVDRYRNEISSMSILTFVFVCLLFEQHSFPPFQPITIRVTYFENCARQRNLTNHFACFILEFTAFKIATLEEVFDVVRKTFQISSLLWFSITYEL